MKTIADFKKRMVIGAKVETTLYHINKQTGEYVLAREYGERTVTKHQNNSFALATVTPDGIKDSWCDWPKKVEFAAIDKDTIQISFTFGKLLYKFITT